MVMPLRESLCVLPKLLSRSMAACRSDSVGSANAICRACQTATASESTSSAERYWPESTALLTMRSIRGGRWIVMGSLHAPCPKLAERAGAVKHRITAFILFHFARPRQAGEYKPKSASVAPVL